MQTAMGDTQEDKNVVMVVFTANSNALALVHHIAGTTAPENAMTDVSRTEMVLTNKYFSAQLVFELIPLHIYRALTRRAREDIVARKEMQAVLLCAAADREDLTILERHLPDVATAEAEMALRELVPRGQDGEHDDDDDDDCGDEDEDSLAGMSIYSDEVLRMLIIGHCAGGELREEYEEFAARNSLELVAVSAESLAPSDGGGAGGSERLMGGESTGLKRVVEALHTANWNIKSMTGRVAGTSRCEGGSRGALNQSHAASSNGATAGRRDGTVRKSSTGVAHDDETGSMGAQGEEDAETLGRQDFTPRSRTQEETEKEIGELVFGEFMSGDGGGDAGVGMGEFEELMREVVGVRQQIGSMNDDERRAQAARMALKFAEAHDLLDEEDE